MVPLRAARTYNRTVFRFGRVDARTGAKGTRFFKKLLEERPGEARSIAEEALRCMPHVRSRWPRSSWPQPAGLQPHELEIVLPAFLLATGMSDDDFDRRINAS